jgi:hypothetical protein
VGGAQEVRRESVQRLAMGWTTVGSEFKSRWGQKFYLLHSAQTGSGAHLMGTGGSFLRDDAAGA